MSQDALREAVDRIEIHVLHDGCALAIDSRDRELLGRVYTEHAFVDLTSAGRDAEDESTPQAAAPSAGEGCGIQ